MRIRTATPSDAAAIAHLHAESWRSAYREVLSEAYLNGDVVADRTAVWAKRMNAPPPNQYVALAEAGGQLLGYVCAYGNDDPRWGTLLDNLHVSPEAKRQGIGARLMATAASWSLRVHPGAGLYLWVLVPNAQARRFYERLGAVNAGEDVWLPPDGGAVPKLRYAWPVLTPLLRPE